MKLAPHAALAISLSVTCWPLAAPAARQPRYLPSAGLELASGARPRTLRTVHWRRVLPDRAPGRAIVGPTDASVPSLADAWAAWDDATGVPSRIVLRPVTVPGACGEPAVAASFARRVLEQHRALLAPGAQPGDFVLRADELERGQRTVLFEQRYRGLPVLGGEVSFRFKADRLFLVGSTALPMVSAELPSVAVSPETASEIAVGWVGSSGSADAVAAGVGAPLVLPLLSDTAVLGYRVVVPVTVESHTPRARYLVYVDAASGQAVARRQTLHFAEGTLLFNAPRQHAAAERLDFAAPFVSLTVAGEAATSSEAGLVSFADGGPVELGVGPSGARVAVVNAVGAKAATTLVLEPGGSSSWNAASDPPVDAQLSAFVHVSRARARALELAPLLSWLGGQVTANVNIADVCNAFYDGVSLNFLAADSSCQNTALVADVVYHEYGHALHHRSVFGSGGQFEEALSEGLSDYFAASITGDSAVGRGFFYDETPLRDFDPPDREYVWPDDVEADPHGTGLILAGALWDLRKVLWAAFGEAEGRARMDPIQYGVMRHAVDIPSSYLEALAADDDDGNLQNGTPNGCAIDQAFAAHGLRPIALEPVAPSVASPELDGYEVSVTVGQQVRACASSTVQSAELRWRLRSQPEQESTVPMTGGPEQYVATIPAQAAPAVVEYRIVARLGDGTEVSLPSNPADPYYQLYVGDVEPLYCTDFEIDPELDGWTHGLTSGENVEGADDWQWGEPNGTAQNGDPSGAWSGTMVYGNDLGAGDYNGMYQSDKTNYTLSPTVDVRGLLDVRLQYRRWLNVEDGQYDRATIYANDVPVWTNRASPEGEPGNVHHADREWRFHDVPLSGAVRDGKVAVTLELASDGQLEFGGWTLDDLCIVGQPVALPAHPHCGNGRIDEGEQCDDGNRDSGDGCDAGCQLETDDPALVPGGGCSCAQPGDRRPAGGSRSGIDAGLGLGLFALVALGRPGARRRRASGLGSAT